MPRVDQMDVQVQQLSPALAGQFAFRIGDQVWRVQIAGKGQARVQDQ